MKNIFMIIGIAGAILANGACAHGGVSQKADGMHEVLNAMTYVIDPLYEASVLACDRVEQSIIERPPSTYKKDKQSLEQVRLACNKAFGAFDEMRVLQKKARSVIDSVRQDLGASISEAEKVVEDLSNAAHNAKTEWTRTTVILKSIVPSNNKDGGSE